MRQRVGDGQKLPGDLCPAKMGAMGTPKSLGVVLFPDFELLDVFGPLELLGMLPEHYAPRPQPEPQQTLGDSFLDLERY